MNDNKNSGAAAGNSFGPLKGQATICKLVRRGGRRPALVAYHQPDALLEQLQRAQMAVEGLIVRAGSDDLLADIRQLAVDLAELSYRYQSKPT